MTRVRLPLPRIAVIDRLRAVDDGFVGVLMLSIQERGLDIPIKVRPGLGPDGADHLLVAGMHRLEAARRLGWDEIDVDISEMSADDALLAEIDENLMRRELAPLDRAVFMARRYEVWSRQAGKLAGKGGDRRSEDYRSRAAALEMPPDVLGVQHRFASNFAEAASGATGWSLSTVKELVQIGQAIDRTAQERIKRSPVATKHKQLLALARVSDVGRREAMIDVIARGEVEDVAAAERRIGGATRVPAAADPERLFTLLSKAWENCPAAERQKFLVFLRSTELL